MAGSPPHTRGKGCHFHCELAFFGITPAHAGKSTFVCSPLISLTDHPRTRGEKVSISKYFFGKSGSPPHTRGKVGNFRTRRIETGITPAHAGKSVGEITIFNVSQDHPRTRGEKKALLLVKICQIGSPPHTRGKVFYIVFFSMLRRITPAHAGKSLFVI